MFDNVKFTFNQWQKAVNELNDYLMIDADRRTRNDWSVIAYLERAAEKAQREYHDAIEANNRMVAEQIAINKRLDMVIS